MKTPKFLLFAFAFTLLSFSNYAQQADSSSYKLLGRIVGSWNVESVMKGNKAVSAPKNATASAVKKTVAPSPKTMTYPTAIRFTIQAKYVFIQDKQKLDSGSFNTNENLSAIYLQSAIDKDHLQEWKVILKTKDSLTLEGKKGSKSEGVKIECARAAEEM